MRSALRRRARRPHSPAAERDARGHASGAPAAAPRLSAGAPHQARVPQVAAVGTTRATRLANHLLPIHYLCTKDDNTPVYSRYYKHYAQL